MRALIVEDDLTIAEFVARGLRESGFAVDHAADGQTGLDLATTAQYDVAVIDVMLPKLDGLSLIQAMRRRQVTTPVLILSAKHPVDDRVKGLETGGDDYLTKPFAFPELLARVQALIRRATGAPASTHLTVGPRSPQWSIGFDLHGLVVTANEKTAYITARGVADEIKVLNLNGTGVSTIEVNPRPGVADRPDSLARKGSNLYVTVQFSGQVARIKTQTGSVEYIDVAPPATTGYAVHGI